MYTIDSNKYGFAPEQLFAIGKRELNTKRSFLFVSKLLGKHLSVRPEVVRATGYLLASLRYGFNPSTYVDCIKEDTLPSYDAHAVDNDVLVIGFCETATALGLSVALAIQGSTYISTTREPIYGYQRIVSFEEAHSHATTHNMFSNVIQMDRFKRIILVDDEITTGNSFLHLMEALLRFPQIKEITILSILDWRDENHRNAFRHFSNVYGITISVYSLISGMIRMDDHALYKNGIVCRSSKFTQVLPLEMFPKTEVQAPDGTIYRYITDTGRFGLSYEEMLMIEGRAKEAATLIGQAIGEAHRLLVLGHGENIYIPSRVAACLERMGYVVRFKTTSRTPIHCDGTLFKDIVEFQEKGTNYHFYNLHEAETYDRVILLCEDGFPCQLSSNMMTFNL